MVRYVCVHKGQIEVLMPARVYREIKDSYFLQKKNMFFLL